MNILFITPSYKPAYIYGGPIVVISLLAEHLAKLGHRVTVVTTTANGAQELDVTASEPIVIDGVTVYYFKRNTGDHTHVSVPLWRFLWKHVTEFDAVHIHSWWNFLVLGAAWICRQKGVVPVLSPHGMFSNYILETNNSSKKKWLHWLFGKSLLQRTQLHVSTKLEWDESQHIISGWQGAVIPNLVMLPERMYERPENNAFTVGFLSRVDPKKGLDILIKALSGVSFSYRLLIAGAGEQGYENELRQLSERLGNSKAIRWQGWKSGEEKFAFLAQLDLFALTSHSENFAIVVIESLSVGTPVLISKEVGLYQYVQDRQLGWVTSTKEEEVRRALETIYADKSRLQKITAMSKGIIEKDFDPAYLAGQYVNLYQN